MGSEVPLNLVTPSSKYIGNAASQPLSSPADCRSTPQGSVSWILIGFQRIFQTASRLWRLLPFQGSRSVWHFSTRRSRLGEEQLKPPSPHTFVGWPQPAVRASGQDVWLLLNSRWKVPRSLESIYRWSEITDSYLGILQNQACIVRYSSSWEVKRKKLD